MEDGMEEDVVKLRAGIRHEGRARLLYVPGREEKLVILEPTGLETREVLDVDPAEVRDGGCWEDDAARSMIWTEVEL
jgi:hypothetical protein